MNYRVRGFTAMWHATYENVSLGRSQQLQGSEVSGFGLQTLAWDGRSHYYYYYYSCYYYYYYYYYHPETDIDNSTLCNKRRHKETNPKGPCTQIGYTLALKWSLCRYFGAKVYTI